MLQAYKYRIKPSKAIKYKFNGTLEICRELYNAGLQERREAYKRGLILNRDKNAACNILARGISILQAEGLSVSAPGGLALVGQRRTFVSYEFFR
jgi:transposase